MTYPMAVVAATYTGLALLVYAAQGAQPFWWFVLGGCVLVFLVVTVEALRSHE